MKLPPDIKEALEACPLPHELKSGGKHIKLYIAGRMIGTFSGSGKVKAKCGVGHLAIVKRIRAIVAEAERGGLL